MSRFLTGLLIIVAVCCSSICVGSEKQGAESEPTKSQGQSGEAKKVKKKIELFKIGENRVAVILDITEQPGYAPSYNAYEIKNEVSKSYYKETLGPGTDIEGVFKLEGKSGEGLIIYFDTEPNAPLAGKSFQIFGIEKGKVKPLSAPINVYGRMEQLPSGKSTNALKLFHPDLVKVEVWKDCFGVVIPLVVDLKKLTITPLRTEGIFDINIGYTPDQPHRSIGITVKLYADHNVNAKEERIAATDVKKVEFINAYADVQFKKDKWRDIDVSNLWLKVNINGKEGWVNDLEDFFTLGLIPSG
jgi:hypothetical protein